MIALAASAIGCPRTSVSSCRAATAPIAPASPR